LTGLLDSLTVRGYTLRNRIVLPPLQTGRATFEGAVTNRLINFYVRRSAAVGLPIVEHAYISLAGKLSFKQLGIHNDELIPGLTILAKAIHDIGAPAILQITHAGGVANKKIIGEIPAGPSPTNKSRQLQIKELLAIVEEFGVATERAVKAGFDGVEFHGAHGFLLNQFFSPLMNKRNDEFGGSLENRMCFPLLAVDRVREALQGRLLLYRLGADDLAPNGIQIEDASTFASELEKHGVDIIDVSGGMCGSEPKQLHHIKGYFVPQAAYIKKAVKIPIIGVGGITEPEFADQLIKEKQVDLVAIGRALWKDHQWAEKAVEKLRAK
jgi:NADPH2 dehydrogenase